MINWNIINKSKIECYIKIKIIIFLINFTIINIKNFIMIIIYYFFELLE